MLRSKYLDNCGSWVRTQNTRWIPIGFQPCSAPNDGYFYHKATMLFPGFFVLGVALVLFPGYKEERIARGEDISAMQRWQLITLRWWVILAVAFGDGIGNYILMSSLLS